MEVTTHSSIARPKLKHITHIFRDIPPLPETLLDLFRFCSAYYHHPLGEVVMNGLPSRLRSGEPFVQHFRTTLQYRLTAAGRAAEHPPSRLVILSSEDYWQG